MPDREDFSLQIQNRSQLSQIEEYVSGLDPLLQAVFRLRLYGERSFPEIAVALGEPEATVKTQYYRLLAKLRKEFDPYG